MTDTPSLTFLRKLLEFSRYEDLFRFIQEHAARHGIEATRALLHGSSAEDQSLRLLIVRRWRTELLTKP